MSETNFIEEMFEKGVLVSEDMLEAALDDESKQKLLQEKDLLVINKDSANIITASTDAAPVNWYDLDSQRVDEEMDDEQYLSHIEEIKQPPQATAYSELEQELSSKVTPTHEDTLIEVAKAQEEEQTPVSIVFSYENVPKKYTIRDFSHIFLTRFRFLSGVLRQRQELKSALPIHRLLGKNDKEQAAVIGVVETVHTTKNGHLLITLEDPTGKIPILISHKNKDMMALGKELVPDEVVGFSGQGGGDIFFANSLFWPDIPSTHIMKKGSADENLLFLSDIHVGSKLFMKEAFDKFLKWINGNTGNEQQRETAQKVKYIVIAGDLVDGIGIYPSQYEELELHDIKDQYDYFTDLLEQIPKDKQIIICPGNHDVVHLAEPQPVFYKEYTQRLHDMENVTLVSNPAMVNVGKTKTFPGFNVLLYHGYSFDHYISNVESIRNNGGYHRADLVMEFLLKRRHLAPTFGSTPYFPGHVEDPLLIKQIPDFFITGHIHYSKVSNYRGVTMICGSCWQEKTDFQEKLGHEPEPGRVPVVNLQTRQVKVLRFV